MRLCRFNVYHAVHSTSVLPLSKVTQVVAEDPFTIFASTCPDAFPDDGPPLAQMSYDRKQTIVEHRQLGISMKSGNVYVSPSYAVLPACEGHRPLRGLCPSRDHGCLLNIRDAWHLGAAQASLAMCAGFDT